MTATVRSVELRATAQAIADTLPSTAEEAVLTGSVSRGVADAVSDIEMLVVTSTELEQVAGHGQRVEEDEAFAVVGGVRRHVLRPPLIRRPLGMRPLPVPQAGL